MNELPTNKKKLMKLIKESSKSDVTKEITQYAIDNILDLKGGGEVYGADLHNEIFNTDMYIENYNEAERWLIKNVGIFNAIDFIIDYEKNNFGEVNTNMANPENVVNMYVYIQGEEILHGSETLREKWDDVLTDEDLDKIAAELEQYL